MINGSETNVHKVILDMIEFGFVHYDNGWHFHTGGCDSCDVDTYDELIDELISEYPDYLPSACLPGEKEGET